MATDVTASLPDLILAPGSTITVELDDALSVVTQLNVYGFSPARESLVEATAIPPLFAYAPDAA